MKTMRCGYSEAEHFNSPKDSYGESLKAALAAHQENWAKSPETIFKEMLANQEASINQAWAKARAIWNNEDGSTTHFHLWTNQMKISLLNGCELFQSFWTSSGPVSRETASKVRALLLQFEEVNKFGIEVTVSVYTDTYLSNAVEVSIKKPACTKEQVLEVFTK